MAQTVKECLTAATDSVSLINAINTDASSVKAVKDMTQAEINVVVQRNVDHLEIILDYDGTDNLPNVKGSSDDKTSYTDAVTTGKAYIAAN